MELEQIDNGIRSIQKTNTQELISEPFFRFCLKVTIK